jgi:hypothetical protein
MAPTTSQTGWVRAPQAVYSPHIQFKVARIHAGSDLVGLFFQHNLVDQPSNLGITDRVPWTRSAGQPSLQRLEQRHEVPHRVDVVLHKRLNRLEGVHPLVNRMVGNAVKTIIDRPQ